MALGAQEIIMSSWGELGPLDTQISKRDEVFEAQSGLTVSAALEALRRESYAAFQDFLARFKTGVGRNATLKTASEVAARLSTGLFGHVYSQIDPLNVGEMQRSMLVAKEYGLRLQPKSGNYTTEMLEHLINAYPSHEFVIDRSEASQLFGTVREPTLEEYLLMLLLGDRALIPAVEKDNVPLVPRFLNDEKSLEPKVSGEASDRIGEVPKSEQSANPETAASNGRAAESGGGQPGDATSGGASPIQ